MVRVSNTPSKPEISTLKMRFDEAWHGWLKPLSSILLLLGGYLLYDGGLLPEPTAGLLVVLLIVGGTLSSAGWPLLGLVDKRPHKVLVGLFLAMWAVGAGYLPLRRALPTKALGEPVRIGYCSRYKDIDKHECAESALASTATLPKAGPYEIAIAGQLKGQGELESNYRLTLNGAGGVSQEVSGSLKRTFFRQRTSRRGSGSRVVREEHTESAHRLTVVGPTLKITADGMDEQLEDGLTLTFREAGLDPRFFLGLIGLCLLIGLWLDFRFAAPKVKTYVTMGVVVSLVFAWDFPNEATPHSLVRPAIAALLLALVAGCGGWLLAAVVKSFKPRLKKTAK